MRSVVLVALFACAGWACGSGDGPPLGGPHGGTGASVAPTGGSSTSASSEGSNGGGTSPSGNDQGTTPTTGDDAGAASPDDAGGATLPEAGGESTGTPTWSQIYTQYLAPGTMGSCSTCHSQMDTAAGAYTWLVGQKQLGGSTPALTNPAESCLSWLGGNMPPNGPTSEPTATAQLQAWVAAGAQNN